MIRIEGNTCFIDGREVLNGDKIENSNKITKVVVVEGNDSDFGQDLGGFIIGNLPNLEEIEFPMNITRIKKNSVQDCPKVTSKGLILKNKDCMFDFCTSIRNRANGDEQMKSIAAERLQVLDDPKSSLEECMIAYNQVVLTVREKQTQMEYSDKLYKVMKNKGYSINNIIDTLNKNKVLSCAELQFFSGFIQEKMGIPRRSIYLEKENSRKAMIEDKTNIVYVGYNTIIEDNYNDTEAINAEFLFAIAHEFQHLRQKNNGKDINNINSYEDALKAIDYIDEAIPNTKDSRLFGDYSGYHDLLSDEIRADIDACDLLIDVFSSHPTLKKHYEDKKLERIKKAHGIGEDGVVTIEDYRMHVLDSLLTEYKLSDKEREKLTILKSKYEKIKEACERKGIDLFKSSLGKIKPSTKQEEKLKKVKRLSIVGNIKNFLNGVLKRNSEEIPSKKDKRL